LMPGEWELLGAFPGAAQSPIVLNATSTFVESYCADRSRSVVANGLGLSGASGRNARRRCADWLCADTW
jgi:hypothetical protein